MDPDFGESGGWTLISTFFVDEGEGVRPTPPPHRSVLGDPGRIPGRYHLQSPPNGGHAAIDSHQLNHRPFYLISFIALDNWHFQINSDSKTACPDVDV